MLEIELYVSFENRGLNIYIIFIDNRHIVREKFDGFGVDNFFNVKKIFKVIISKKEVKYWRTQGEFSTHRPSIT